MLQLLPDPELIYMGTFSLILCVQVYHQPLRYTRISLEYDVMILGQLGLYDFSID